MSESYKHAPEITDEVIRGAFKGTNFGRTDYREFLGYSVLKKACGWHCGHTITTIMIEMGLITPKGLAPTKLGKMFLSDCYDDPRRTRQAECKAATDAYASQLRAEGVEMFAKQTRAIGEQEKCAEIIYAAVNAETFAANLRKENGNG